MSIRQTNFVVDSLDNHKDYDNVNINDINNIINGYLKSITCTCLDKIPIKAREPVFREIMSKLAFEGEAVFKMINGTVLADRIQKNEINCEKLSEHIENAKSVWTEYKITDMIHSLPNIQIKKMYIENIYSVMVLTKINV